MDQFTAAVDESVNQRAYATVLIQAAIAILSPELSGEHRDIFVSRIKSAISDGVLGEPLPMPSAERVNSLGSAIMKEISWDELRPEFYRVASSSFAANHLCLDPVFNDTVDLGAQSIVKAFHQEKRGKELAVSASSPPINRKAFHQEKHHG